MAAPVLMSGLGSLFLSEAEIKVMETHFKNTIQNLQRLHQNTPRGVVYLLSGSLPGRAVLHCRQLSLFLMVCYMPNNPLHRHAKYILTCSTPSAKSWFQQIRDICCQYGLPAPLQLLNSPPAIKDHFKIEFKSKVAKFWHSKLVEEISRLNL